MLRLLEIFFFFYLGYIFLKNILGIFRPQPPQERKGYDQGNTRSQSYRTPGEIHVDHIPDSKEADSLVHHNPNEEDGEYISFKEIKD